MSTLEFIDSAISRLADYFLKFHLTDVATGPVYNTGIHEWHLCWGRRPVTIAPKSKDKPEKIEKKLTIYVSICRRGTSEEIEAIPWSEAPPEMRLIMGQGIKSLYSLAKPRLNWAEETAKNAIDGIHGVLTEIKILNGNAEKESVSESGPPQAVESKEEEEKEVKTSAQFVKPISIK